MRRNRLNRVPDNEIVVARKKVWKNRDRVAVETGSEEDVSDLIQTLFTAGMSDCRGRGLGAMERMDAGIIGGSPEHVCRS